MRAFRTAKRLQLFLYDLGVLDHGDAAALGHFAFQCDRFATVLSELIVHRLVFADDQVGLTVAHNADRTTALDALRATRLPMFFADGVVIDVAHHIDHFAGHLFRSSRVTTVLVFLRNRQRRDRQCGDERRSNRNLHDCRFVVCGIEHEISVPCSARWSINRELRRQSLRYTNESTPYEVAAVEENFQKSATNVLTHLPCFA